MTLTSISSKPNLMNHYTVWIVYTATQLLLELTVWNLSGNSRLTAASTRLSHGKKNLHLTAACIRLSHRVLNAYLIPFQNQLSHGRLQTSTWQVKIHLSRNSCFPNCCLAVNSSRSYLACGTILAMYTFHYNDIVKASSKQHHLPLIFAFLHCSHLFLNNTNRTFCREKHH